MEGIETIVSLRRDNPELPIIAISGGSDPVYLRAAASLGATAALQKPFAPPGAHRELVVRRRDAAAASPKG